MSALGWVGKAVRNADGRQGRIVDEWTGFCHAGLKIAVDGGTEAFIQLNTNGPDSGELGWSWWYQDSDGSGRWYQLGDHNPPVAAKPAA